MRILVVGYGSMGRRRIRLLRQFSQKLEIICVDNNDARYHQIIDDGLPAFHDLREALDENPEIAFVCTSPGNHADIILHLIDAHIHVFTELNLISDYYDEIIKRANSNSIKVFVSSTMLYDKQILTIMKSVTACQEVHSYLYHVGQYLPDWHPWESYKEFFIGNKATNGCREILAIQLPWIIKTFGKVERFHVVKRRNSNLDIDFDDTYIITLEHEGGNCGVFVCDVLARKAVTSLEIMSEHSHVIWNGTPESLFMFDEKTCTMQLTESYDTVMHMEGYADIIIEDQYLDEIKAFFYYLENDKKPEYTLIEDRYVLGLIDEIESA